MYNLNINSGSTVIKNKIIIIFTKVLKRAQADGRNAPLMRVSFKSFALNLQPVSQEL